VVYYLENVRCRKSHEFVTTADDEDTALLKCEDVLGAKYPDYAIVNVTEDGVFLHGSLAVN
jgi:hypothetical protein